MKNVKGPLLVRVTLVNATRGCYFGLFPPGVEYGPYANLSSLFKDMKGEWGGKVTGMYRDRKTDETWETVQVGWVFTKRMKYEDCPDTYTREAWVEVVREEEPSRSATYTTVDVG